MGGMSSHSKLKNRFLHTSLTVKWLVKLLGLTAIGLSIVSPLASHWLGSYSPQTLLSLQAEGIHHLFLWQWISYLFVLTGPLSLGSCISLLFSLYLIWMAGEALIAKVGNRAFIKLCLISGLSGGLGGWLALLALPAHQTVTGAMALAYGLLTAWAMHTPSHRTVVLFLAPLELRWVLLFFLGYSMLNNFSSQHYAVMATYAGSIAGAYVYGLLAWNLAGPFRLTRKFDEAIAKMGVRWRLFRKGNPNHKPTGKVVDLKTRRVVEDRPRDNEAQLRRQRLRAWQANRNDQP